MATRLLRRGLLPRRPARISALRHRSDGPERPPILVASLDVTESVRRLEEAMDEMAVRKAAPPWLPLLPGASYGVPPRRRRADAERVAELIGSVAVPVVEGRAASIKRGRSYFAQGQRRNMFIQTQSSPNPQSLMFSPGRSVMEIGSSDFPNARTAMTSPLAKSLFAIDGVTRVFFGSDFVTVTKSEEASWDFLKPEIFATIMDFYTSGKPLFLDSSVAASLDTAIHEDDSEIVAMIKELLETRIRPSVQDDGGDIKYCGYDPETGIVKLRMQGACSGCPSSSVTLKSGIENMLMHYIPEVRGVEQELEGEEEVTVSN